MIPYLSTILLTIERVGPDGDKVIWILLSLIIIIAVVIYFSNHKNPVGRLFQGKNVSIGTQTNRIFNPSTLTINVGNKSETAITVNFLVIRFVGLGRSKAFKITSVNGNKVYPLFLDGKTNHTLVVSLEPFYVRDPLLKNYFLVKAEVDVAGKGTTKSSVNFLFRNRIPAFK
jgi:hypothetical protein